MFSFFYSVPMLILLNKLVLGEVEIHLRKSSCQMGSTNKRFENMIINLDERFQHACIKTIAQQSADYVSISLTLCNVPIFVKILSNLSIRT